ncbi:hypothetical protein ACTXM8_18135, partial [Brachybacterium alimentarium]|uniref:hypothetical protein n=6 Tax=Brachybacterium TaxID=43668 RepID=UPI003FD0859D
PVTPPRPAAIDASAPRSAGSPGPDDATEPDTAVVSGPDEAPVEGMVPQIEAWPVLARRELTPDWIIESSA